MDLSSLQRMCLTRLCWHIDQPGWADHEAVKLGAYRRGTEVVVFSEDLQRTYTEESFRTFMAYRMFWKYLGLPDVLIAALSNPSGHTLIRNGVSYPFDSQLAQTGEPFTVE